MLCRAKDACIQNGSHVCSEERREDSPLCDVCASGYYRHGEDECIACEEFSFSTSFIWLGLATCFAILLAFRPSRNALAVAFTRLFPIGKRERMRVWLQICISLYQVIKGIGAVFKLNYPQGFNRLMTQISFWESFALPDVGCSIELNYDDRMLLQTLVPTCALVCLSLAFKMTLHHSFVELAYVVLFLVYQSVSAAAFGTFDW